MVETAEGKTGGKHLSEEIFKDEQMKRSINTGSSPHLTAFTIYRPRAKLTRLCQQPRKAAIMKGVGSDTYMPFVTGHVNFLLVHLNIYSLS